MRYNRQDNTTDYAVRTKDSDEAAYLWTLTKMFTLAHVETVDAFGAGKLIAWFCFTSTLPQEEVEAIRSDYQLGRCTVEPKQYAIKRNEIKAIIKEKCFFGSRNS